MPDWDIEVTDKWGVHASVADWLNETRPIVRAGKGKYTRAWYCVLRMAEENGATMDELRRLPPCEWMRQPNLSYKGVAALMELFRATERSRKTKNPPLVAQGG
jgi:hypothetical protein